MGDTTETNTKVLSGEFFLGVVALQTPIQKNNYMHDMGPFPRYCHIVCTKLCNLVTYGSNLPQICSVQRLLQINSSGDSV